MTDTRSVDPEDGKLVVLARGAMARSGGGTGAAVRDRDGRTYAAGQVSLHTLQLSALQAALAAAISSGATELEAAVLVGGDIADPGLVSVFEVSGSARVIVADEDGTVLGVSDGDDNAG